MLLIIKTRQNNGENNLSIVCEIICSLKLCMVYIPK